MLSFSVIGNREVMAHLTALPEKMHRTLLIKITTLTKKLEAYIKDEKLSGQVLNHKSGNLWRSIQSDVSDSDDLIVGKAFSTGDVKYAAIHEFGGIIEHPGGTAYMVIAGKGAVFVSNAKADTLKILGRTKPHPIPMPERSFMRSSLADMKDEIVAGIRDAVAEGAQP